ncbi:hypothetical protein B296_00003886 [Ensete ventricosum]|uniref:Uncharacterized protein n=1 Tax=Ensete ventricosum TaxID=4639 RepID=A0A426YHH3_ENSVE|nr:hypothetical protein B296_00003886 [Ensete ventricosum]
MLPPPPLRRRRLPLPAGSRPAKGQLPLLTVALVTGGSPLRASHWGHPLWALHYKRLCPRASRSRPPLVGREENRRQWPKL